MDVLEAGASINVYGCLRLVVTGRSFSGILLFSQREHQLVGELVFMPWRIKFPSFEWWRLKLAYQSGYMGWAVRLVIITGYVVRLITAVGYMGWAVGFMGGAVGLAIITGYVVRLLFHQC